MHLGMSTLHSTIRMKQKSAQVSEALVFHVNKSSSVCGISIRVPPVKSDRLAIASKVYSSTVGYEATLKGVEKSVKKLGFGKSLTIRTAYRHQLTQFRLLRPLSYSLPPWQT